MPHIRMRALSAAHAASLSETLVEDLARVISTPSSNFTFELIETRFFENGALNKGYPFVEVHWFARNQDIQDTCARVITDQVKALVPDQDVAVIFHVLSAQSYYENGTHF